MDSESEQFEPCLRNTSFFEGFTKAPKLNDKEKKLREDVAKRSELETKQTTLHQKLSNIHKNSEKVAKYELQSEEQMVKQKLIIEQNSKSKSKNKNKKVKMESEEQGEENKTKDKKQKKIKKTFEDLKLIRPILKAVNEMQYTKPTPIQSLAIPTISMGRDVVASSITGSGKTAAFLIPVLQRYFNAVAVGYIRTLILTPTRELAIQIYEQFEKLNKYTRLEAVLAIGASSLQKQESSLRNNPEVVIGTPGRIIDLLINSRSIGMENLEMIVLDEADKLLQLGFEAEIKQVMNHINPQVQTVLFSATMGPSVNRLTSATTSKPIRVSADPDNKTAEKLHQQMIKLREETQEYRESVLLSILTNLYNQKVIIFFKTKKQCHRMAIILGLLGLKACELHGNLSQTQRIQTFIQFKEGKFDFLLATDLASRGLDIKQVKTVINYQLPVQITRYIHRIGRTARAGNVGTSLTLCNDDQCLSLKKMSKKTGDKLFKLSVNETVIRQNIIKINDLEKDIGHIIFEERQERSFRKAEMQLKKAQNITQHRDQIYTRPKKEWFITEKEKKKIQEDAKKKVGILPLQDAPKKKKRIFKQKKRK